MRTQDEILTKIKEVKEEDWMGTITNNLIDQLTFENSKPFLNEGATEKQWEDRSEPVKTKMIDYMEFAWEKANNCRGLSAGRSMDHYYAWLWLDGNDKLAEKTRNYNYYGKPQLVEICDYLGLEHSKWDDNVRSNVET